MGKTHTTIVVVFSVGVLIFGVLFILQTSHTSPQNTQHGSVGDTLYVVLFTDNGAPEGNMLLQVPFNETSAGTKELSIAIDVNGDSIFSHAETFVEHYPVVPTKQLKSGFYIRGKTVFTDGLTAQVTLDGESHMLMTKVIRHEVGELFTLEKVTNPEEAMKGWASKTVQYQHAYTDTAYFTDFSQQKAECAPTVAINSAYSLLKNNEIPFTNTPETHIDELKTDMQWNTTNGVIPEQYITGFTTWAQRHDYPLTVRKTGDAHGNTTLAEIERELERNNAITLRVKFIDTQTGKAAGGHAVTVTHVFRKNDRTFISIHDPATPEGAEIIRIQSNQFTRYGPWEGITLLSWAFAHSVLAAP